MVRKKIRKEDEQRIKEESTIIPVVEKFVQDLRKKGKDWVGTCPECGERKFTVNERKNIANCWICDDTGKSSKGPISYLVDKQGRSYHEALLEIAEMKGISLEWENTEKKNARKKPHQRQKETFRDAQLRESGLEDKDQKDFIKDDKGDEKEIDRYQAKTMDSKGVLIEGDDMAMIYVDLEGKVMKYSHPKKNQDRDMIRMRWHNPGHHKDKDGEPIKYQSPKGSGSKIWIPATVRKYFQRGARIETLYIQEGEKKADKATKHGFPSLGIQGIHNLASKGQLPHEFERIIKTCNVESVVFVVDGDLFDISSSWKKPADLRSRSFYRAVDNFRKYFFEFNTIGIHLQIFFAYVSPENDNKGFDDLLANDYEGREQVLYKELTEKLLKKDGTGGDVSVHNITDATSYQVKSLFHINSKEDFFKANKEDLTKRKTFTFSGIRWKVKEDGQLVPDQEMMPDERFYGQKIRRDQQGEIIEEKFWFDHLNAYKFLYNRGFGRMRMSDGQDKLVRIQKKVIEERPANEIRDFLINFARNTDQPKGAINMLYKGAKVYLGPDSLSNLDHLEPEVILPRNDRQYLFFSKTAWKITKEEVKEMELDQLEGHIWKDDISKYQAIREGELFRAEREKRDGDHVYSLEFSDIGKKCHYAQFLYNASDFSGKKDDEKTEGEKLELYQHFLSKCSAIGYLLHSYRDSSVLKAVVTMDGKDSEAGENNGRSGKSLFGKALSYLVPMVNVNGRKRDLTEDRFIWEEVDERTRIVHINDVKPNVKIDRFYPEIADSFTIEGKGTVKFTLPPEKSPKLLFSTNGAIQGADDSTMDRLFTVAFSDYYNKDHKPVHDFEYLFFDEWGSEQWNLFYNFIADCMQLYLRRIGQDNTGLIRPPVERLEQRRLRQSIGETFLEWADTYFSDENNLDHAIPKNEMYDRGQDGSFLNQFPSQQKYVSLRAFKKKVIDYCKLKGYEFNPRQNGGRYTSGGAEYFVISRKSQQGDDLPF